MTTFTLVDSLETQAKKTLQNQNGHRLAWVRKSAGHGWDVEVCETGQLHHIDHLPKPRPEDKGMTRAESQALQVAEFLGLS